ncbi:MAG: hypothetical protein ABII98_01195, partial [bacterium]
LFCWKYKKSKTHATFIFLIIELILLVMIFYGSPPMINDSTIPLLSNPCEECTPTNPFGVVRKQMHSPSNDSLDILPSKGPFEPHPLPVLFYICFDLLVTASSIYVLYIFYRLIMILIELYRHKIKVNPDLSKFKLK